MSIGRIWIYQTCSFGQVEKLNKWPELFKSAPIAYNQINAL